jgi:hypothetical protein
MIKRRSLRICNEKCLIGDNALYIIVYDGWKCVYSGSNMLVAIDLVEGKDRKIAVFHPSCPSIVLQSHASGSAQHLHSTHRSQKYHPPQELKPLHPE